MKDKLKQKSNPNQLAKPNYSENLITITCKQNQMEKPKAINAGADFKGEYSNPKERRRGKGNENIKPNERTS